MPTHASSVADQDKTDTGHAGPDAQVPATRALVEIWVKRLQAAEAMHVCLHPTYVRHSDAELAALVQQARQDRRAPSQMVADTLAHGARSPARTAWTR